jgi:hypothetical protein
MTKTAIEADLDRKIIESLKLHLSKLCVSCMDEQGNPIAPDKKTLMSARGCLTKNLPGTLIK